MRPVFLTALLVLAVPIPARTQPIPARTQTTETTGDADVVKAAHLGTTGPALLGFLPFAETDKAAQQIEESLVAVATAKGKLHPDLLKAVKDEVPLRRAIAADVICQVGDASQRQAVKILLKDDRVSVRYRVALGLARRSEAEAVPVLIDLLADLAPEQRARCEEFLTELAGDWA